MSASQHSRQWDTFVYGQSNYTVMVASSANDYLACEVFRRRFQLNYDDYKQHHNSSVEGFGAKYFVVIDNRSGQIVALTDVLSELDAANLGTFYSETQFYMSSILSLSGKILEMSNTVVDPEHNSNILFSVLYRAVLELKQYCRFDYLINNLVIPSTDNGRYAALVMEYLRPRHMVDASLQVKPHYSLPKAALPSKMKVLQSSQLHVCLNLGASVCGEMHWDVKGHSANLLLIFKK